MKKHLILVSSLLVLILTFETTTTLQRLAVAQETSDAKFDMASLEKTTAIANRSGTKIVADFYASSKKENIAISPPSMVSTYGALAAVAEGKTREDLQNLLGLKNDEDMHFVMLNRYLIQQFLGDVKKNHFLGWQIEMAKEKGEQIDLGQFSAYRTCGYLLGNSAVCDLDASSQNNLFEKFGLHFKRTNFSETEVAKFNEEIQRISGFEGIIPSNPAMILAVCTAMSVQESWPWETMDDERRFHFDEGPRRIGFRKGIVSDYQETTVNGKSGHLFPLGSSNMILVKCKNGTDLKRYAKTIADEGLLIRPGRKISQRAKLYFPVVRFQTEFDFAEYAQKNNCPTPFAEGAEFTLLSEEARKNNQPVYCSDAKVLSEFEMDMDGISLRQVVYGICPGEAMGRDQRVANNIIIDTPYLVVLTEKKLGTILGMAFIAAPEFNALQEDGTVVNYSDHDFSLDDLPDTVGSFDNGKAPENRSRIFRLEPGDVVLTVNGEKIGGRNDLTAAVNRSPRTMRFTVRDRRGKIYRFETTLASEGYRFGVYSADQSGGGARITSVMANSAATRCRLVE